VRNTNIFNNWALMKKKMYRQKSSYSNIRFEGY
jgi:hypothetical protein